MVFRKSRTVKTAPMTNRIRNKFLCGLMLIGVASVSVAQEAPEPKDEKSKPEAPAQVPESATIPEAPATVNVSEVVFDDKIEERLRSILKSTEPEIQLHDRYWIRFCNFNSPGSGDRRKTDDGKKIATCGISCKRSGRQLKKRCR